MLASLVSGSSRVGKKIKFKVLVHRFRFLASWPQLLNHHKLSFEDDCHYFIVCLFQIYTHSLYSSPLRWYKQSRRVSQIFQSLFFELNNPLDNSDNLFRIPKALIERRPSKQSQSLASDGRVPALGCDDKQWRDALQPQQGLCRPGDFWLLHEFAALIEIKPALPDHSIEIVRQGIEGHLVCIDCIECPDRCHFVRALDL